MSRARVGCAAVALGLLLQAPAAGRAGQAVPGPPTGSLAWTARLLERVSALSKPAGGRVVDRLPPVTAWNQGPVTLLVLAAGHDSHGALWLRVLLPRRPNGSSGWIPAEAAQLARTTWRIDVSTARRTVTVLREGVRIRRFLAVVGAPATPTPRGRLALYERVPLSPTGFLGSWAIHLTGFSDALARFDGGLGQIAIHGRGGASLRDPLGSARSHGCIRLANTAVAFIAAHAPLGTPVLIH